MSLQQENNAKVDDNSDEGLGDEIENGNENPPVFVPEPVDVEHDGMHIFLGGILAGLHRLSPERREMAEELIRAILDRYLWADLNGLPLPPPPPLPRYSPHG